MGTRFYEKLIKETNQDGEEYKYLRGKFPQLSVPKLKILYLLALKVMTFWRSKLQENCHSQEKSSLGIFERVVHRFLCNRRVEYCNVGTVSNLFEKYCELGCNTHFLHTHLDFFMTTVLLWVMSIVKNL